MINSLHFVLSTTTYSELQENLNNSDLGKDLISKFLKPKKDTFVPASEAKAAE